MAANSKESAGTEHTKTVLVLPLKLLILAVALWLFFLLTTRALQRIALTQIAEMTGMRIEAHSVDFDLRGSVFIKKLTIRPGRGQKYDDAMLKAENVYARFGVLSLLLLHPRLKHITVNDFIFDAQYDLDTEQWNMAALKITPPRTGSGKFPVIYLKGGTLRYSKVSEARIKVVAATPIDAKFGPAHRDKDVPVSPERLRQSYSFDIKTAEITGGFGKSSLKGIWRPGSLIVTGGLSSTDIPDFEMAWTINVMAAELDYLPNSDYSLKLVIKDLLSKRGPATDTPALVKLTFLKKHGSFNALQRFFNRYRPWGRAAVELKARGNLKKLSESTLAGTLYCKDISIFDRRFPYRIEHLTGPIELTKDSASLKNLRGRHGDVELFFNGRSTGFGPDWKYQFQITSDNMILDDDLYNALGTKSKRFWSAFAPSGLAAVNYSRSRQSKENKSWALAVELLDTDAIYKNFPYPLKDLTGLLLFEPGRTTALNALSQWDGRKITINGTVTTPDVNQTTYDISIDANNIPLDSTLSAALSDRQRQLYNRLHSTGIADAQVRVLTSETSAAPIVTANVQLKQASLSPDYFPLAFSDVSAAAVITDDFVQIDYLNGNCALGPVSLTGRIWPAADTNRPRYHLALSAEQAQLNDALFDILPPRIRKTIDELEPKGRINYTAEMSRDAGSDLIDYKVTIDCLGNTLNLEPLSYPLKDVTGRLTVTTETTGALAAAGNGRVTIRPEAIKITGWLSYPDNVTGAGRLKLALEDVKLFGAGTDEKYVDFTASVGFDEYDPSFSPLLTDLSGVMKIKGLYKSGDGFYNTNANLSADTLLVQNKTLTNLTADISYEPNNRSWVSHNLVADCYDGWLTGRFRFAERPESAPYYVFQVGFGDIDLIQFLSDPNFRQTHSHDYTSGKMSGSLSVGSAVSQGNSRIGQCRLQITDMQVGRLSPLAKLLNVLKLTEPADFAFEQMFVDSYLKDNGLFLRRFDLSGASAAFGGTGRIDLQAETVDITLTARSRRRRAVSEPTLWQSLTEGLGHAVVRMEVTGDMYDPQVETRALPVIGDSLEILGTKPPTPKP